MAGNDHLESPLLVPPLYVTSSLRDYLESVGKQELFQFSTRHPTDASTH